MNLANLIPGKVKAWVAKSITQLTRDFLTGNDDNVATSNHLGEPYNQSPWVFSAVNMVSGEFTGLPVKFYSGDQEYTDPAFAAWWAAPAIGNDGKRMSRDAVDRLLAMWMQLEGEYFILLDDTWMVSASRNVNARSPFIIARPDRIRFIVQAGVLLGYAWRDAGGRQLIFLPEQVIHKMEPNPYDDWRGLGRQKVGKVATESVFLTGVYVRELMRNNGDQGMVVIGKSGIAGDGQKEQIVAALREKRNARRRGIAKDIFVTGDITVDREKEQAAGVDLMNMTSLSHQEIYITFGVPPSFTTVKASYSIGKDSDRYQLITGTSQPLAKKISATYAELANRQIGKNLTAEHEWDEHPVMQDVRNSRLDSAAKLWLTGIPWEQINEYLDLGMKPFPGWNVGFVPFSVSPVDASGQLEQPDPAEDPALGEPAKMLPEIAMLRALVLTRNRAKENSAELERKTILLETSVLAGFTCNCGNGSIAQKADRPPSEIAQWRTMMTLRGESVKSYQSAFGRLLMQARIETLKKVESKAAPKTLKLVGTETTAVETKGAVADLLFDLSKFRANFNATMRKQGQAAAEKSGVQLFAELGRDDPFSFAPHEVLDFLSDRENKLSNVPDDIFARIRDTLSEGIDNGDSTTDLAARVRSTFTTLGVGESQRIAQTEVSAAYGFGRQAAMVKAHVKFKRWLTSGNANVRAAHADANGQTVEIDEAFIVDGEELMHPGDSDGSPGNVINCHCVSIAVASKPEEDNE